MVRTMGLDPAGLTVRDCLDLLDFMLVQEELKTSPLHPLPRVVPGQLWEI